MAQPWSNWTPWSVEDPLTVQEEEEIKAHNERVLRNRDERWIAGKMTDVGKMLEDPRRFLQERFPEGDQRRNVVTIRSVWKGDVQRVAASLGLAYKYVEGPRPLPGQEEFDISPSWLVIGRIESAFKKKVAAIDSQAKKREREIEDHEAEQERVKRQRIEDALRKCDDWDVTGKWKIAIPALTESDEIEDIKLEIFQEKTPKGIQMHAKFDFGIVQGAMRFERQKGEKRAPYDKTLDKKSDHREPDDDDYSYDPDYRSPTPEAFYLGTTPIVGETHSCWNYRWRGEELESHVEGRADQYRNQITFCGPRGFTLTGTFESDVLAKCEITGEKVGVSDGDAGIDIVDSWNHFSDREGDRRSRW